MPATPAPDKPATPHRSRSRARRVAAPALISILGLLAVLAILHPFILREIVEHRLGRALGCRVHLGAATFGDGARLVLFDARLRAPGTPGAGGVVLEAPRVEAIVSWSDLLSGGQGVRLLRLFDPVVRLSQGIDDGELNILRFGGGSMGAGHTLAPLPAVEFLRGRVEFGEHSASQYTVLAEMDVSGVVRVPDLRVAEYEVSLVETRADGEVPARLKGRFDLDAMAGALEMTDLRLGLWRAWAAPTQARDLWRQMAIDGLVARSVFSVDTAGDFVAQFDVRGVDLTTPVPSPVPGEGQRLIRARSVDGVIRFESDSLTADLTGLVEDFPGRLTLRTQGLSLDAPLTAEISTERFVLSEHPELLPYAPPAVQELFRKFSSPTGEVEGVVRLSRAAPTADGPAPVLSTGEIRFRNARGAFDAFPYPFEDMTGLVRFDDDKVEIVEVLGVGPTGARLRATGVIAPPQDHAAVDLDLRIENVPTDDVLHASMPADRREFLDALMDRAALDSLREAGLAMSSEERQDLARRMLEAQAERDALADAPGASARRAELGRRIESVRAALETPVFDIGGRADVNVQISRPAGLGNVYSTRVEIHFDQTGLVPRVFPYPFRATDMRVVFDEERATATAQRLDGLSGASATFTANIRLRDETGAPATRPRITIDVPRGPIDEYLIRAIPEGDRSETGPTIREALRRLRLSGDVSAHVRIGGERDGHTVYEALVTLLTARAEPEAPAPMNERPETRRQSLPIEDMRGQILVSDRGFVVGPITGLLGAAASPMMLAGEWRRAGAATGEPSAFSARLEIERLDLSEPVEALVAAVDPDAAGRTAERRIGQRLEGTARAAATAESVAGGLMATSATLTDIRNLAFDAAGARFTAETLAGVADFSALGVEWNGVEGAFALNGAPLGRLRIDGVAGIADDAPLDMTVRSDEMFITPALIRAAAGERLPPALDRWIDRAQPTVEAAVEARVRRGDAGETAWDALVRPQRADLVTRAGVVHVDDMTGAVRFEPAGGRIESLTAVGDGFTASVAGAWRTGAETTVDVTMNLSSSGAPAGLLALAPESVETAARAMELRVDGPWSVSDARLQWRGGALRLFASADFQGARCNPGVEVSGASGTARIGVERVRGSSQTLTDLEINLDTLHLAGLRMTDGRVRARSGGAPGRTSIDEWRAECSGGRVTGWATLDAAPSAEGEALWYEAVIEMAGVRLGTLLTDIASARAVADGAPDAPSAAVDRFSKYSGRIDGSFALAGRAGDIQSRRGRGSVRVTGGSLVDAPLLVPILELSNLRVPSGEALDRAEAEFFLVGKRATFETLRVHSDSLSMEGEGTVTWPSLALDLEFRSRASGRIPILSDILEGLRDEIATTTVTGTLRDPQFGAVPFSGTRKVLDSVFGGGDGER